MDYLASDDLEGREAGTPGYDLAAAYVAAEFEKLGLAPAGDNGTYFQTITFLRAVRAPDGRNLTITDASGQALPLTENVNAVIRGSVRGTDTGAEGQAVFVGFGVVAPDLWRDDYANLYLNGKIAVMLSGTPKGIQSEERAYYGTRKQKNASDRGAIGVISIETPTSKGIYPFKRLIAEGRLDSANLTWLQADGTPYSLAPTIVAAAGLSLEAAPELFKDAPASWEAIIAAAEAEGGSVPSFDLPLTVSITQR